MGGGGQEPIWTRGLALTDALHELSEKGPVFTSMLPGAVEELVGGLPRLPPGYLTYFSAL